MTFDSYLLKKQWLRMTGKIIVISNVLLGLLYGLYLTVSGDSAIEKVGVIFYSQTHFIIFNMVVLPLYLLMASTMIGDYFHNQIKIKYSEQSIMVRSQVMLLIKHTMLFIVIVNLPMIVLLLFYDGIEFLLFSARSILLQVPGYILVASVLLYIYSRNQLQGISLLCTLLLAIMSQIVGTVFKIEWLKSLDYYIYAKHIEGFSLTEGMGGSILFIVLAILISSALFFMTARLDTNLR